MRLIVTDGWRFSLEENIIQYLLALGNYVGLTSVWNWKLDFWYFRVIFSPRMIFEDGISSCSLRALK